MFSQKRGGGDEQHRQHDLCDDGSRSGDRCLRRWRLSNAQEFDLMAGRMPSLLAFAAACAFALVSSSDIVYYTPPPHLTPDKAVIVLGSKDPKSLLEASEFHFVSAIDGKAVEDAAYRWDRPLLVTAGEPHHLRLGYGWGRAEGRVEVEFTGTPGATVVVKGETIDPDKEARLWLEERATGQILGGRQTARLTYTAVHGAYVPGI
jgi:hypothetical protein